MECSDGKLFVGGIKETSEEKLKEHFSQYGPVKKCKVMKDWTTNTSRGFGFVTFADPSHVDQALNCRYPKIDGRTVEVKPAILGEIRPHNPNGFLFGGYEVKPAILREIKPYNPNGFLFGGSFKKYDDDYEYKPTKIFVGGLSGGLTNDDLKNYFEEFGKVEHAVVMHDKITRTPRGFGFITFESEDAVENVLRSEKVHVLGRRRVEVKRATPKIARYNIYDANKTGFELGFGRDMNMISNGCHYDYFSGMYHPSVCCGYEGNPYNGGLNYYHHPSPPPLPSYVYYFEGNPCNGGWQYYYCPSLLPFPSYNCATPGFNGYGSDIYNDRWTHDNHANNYSRRGVYMNGGVYDNVRNAVRGDPAESESRASSLDVSSRSNDNDDSSSSTDVTLVVQVSNREEVEVLIKESNGVDDHNDAKGLVQSSSSS